MAEVKENSTLTTFGCRVISFDDSPESTGYNYESIVKSDTSEQLNPEDSFSSYDWIQKPYIQKGLELIVDHSTILPQCIKAYGDNIAGFGVGVKYKDEYNGADETPEMEAEFERVENIIKMLGAEMDTKEILSKAVKHRETFGIAYIECIRNLKGDVVQIECIKDVPSVDKTKPIGEYISFDCQYGDEVVTRNKQFRKYRQRVSGKEVYFKEFGDPRIMNKNTGEYVQSLDIKDRANEILEFTVGDGEYGKVRWIGQILPQDGARRAEQLNNNYFVNGRHIPLMICVRGGSLTEESEANLKKYLRGARGENAQHGFLIIQTENDGNRAGFSDEKQPEVEIVPLASILQQDELFQSYQDNARKKAQSAFLLPDLYVGYTTDFNRATAQTVMEVTEQQVFQTERASIEWQLNNKLLKSYNFKFCEVFLKGPEITNPDDMAKLLAIANNAGGVTPNFAKEIANKALGKVSEDYNEEWGDIPLAYIKSQTSNTLDTVNTAIFKAQKDKADDIIPILKAVKDALREFTEHLEDTKSS